METSIESTIEKIKLQEHDNEAKLKEKRSYDSLVISLNRGVRDALTNATKLQQENQEVERRVDALRSFLQVEKLRKTALTALFEQTQKELLIYQEKSAKGISSVLNLRSMLCKSVQKVSDQCDVWALFAKPSIQLPLPKRAVHETIESAEECCDKLQIVIQKYTELQARRDRLLREPETGKDFIRNQSEEESKMRNQIPQLATKSLQFLRFSLPNNGTNRLASTSSNENEPVKFSTSGAAKTRVTPIMRKPNSRNPMPWYQPYSVVGSVAVFLLYFCYLREESDIDLEFEKTLYERIHGLEKEQLLQSYRYNKEHGESVVEIEKRLKEIEEDESRSQH